MSILLDASRRFERGSKQFCSPSRDYTEPGTATTTVLVP